MINQFRRDCWNTTVGVERYALVRLNAIDRLEFALRPLTRVEQTVKNYSCPIDLETLKEAIR